MSKTVYIPNLVQNYFLKYLIHSFKVEATYARLAPNVKYIMLEICVPLLYKVAEDEACWRDDPIEYIRKEADLSRAFYSAKSSAVEFLRAACEKGELLDFFL
jgi:hypothetical protein